MFPSPHWCKVLRDLWGNKTRTVLIILSIAIGMASMGVVAGKYSIITHTLPASYAQVNLASVSIETSGFDDEMVQAIRNLNQMEDAEGHASLRVRLKVGWGVLGAIWPLKRYNY